jgi:hypothetical protein
MTPNFAITINRLLKIGPWSGFIRPEWRRRATEFGRVPCQAAPHRKDPDHGNASRKQRVNPCSCFRWMIRSNLARNRSPSPVVSGFFGRIARLRYEGITAGYSAGFPAFRREKLAISYRSGAKNRLSLNGLDTSSRTTLMKTPGERGAGLRASPCRFTEFSPPFICPRQLTDS